MEIPRLQFQEIARNAAFHAVRSARGSLGEVRLHCHDFYEWIIVIEGEGRHQVNGADVLLRKGQLVLVRPDDKHGIYPSPMGIDFINVAFPHSVWKDYVQATGLQAAASKWCESTAAPSLDLPLGQRQSVWHEAKSATISYHHNPTRLAFGAFWQCAAGALASATESDEGRLEQPAWLRNTIMWAQSAPIEDLSLETLVEASKVSFGHLSRTLKAACGQTPTELINDLRVKRAAYDLAATDRDITTIAFDCGFENLSYFYRRFRQFHGKSPRAYREEARRPLPAG